jgi:two-component system sensor histidine kinase BarA
MMEKEPKDTAAREQDASRPRTPTLPVRDEQQALLTAGGNPRLAAELFAAFLEELGPQFEQIRRHRDRQEWQALRDTTHRLHGSTAYCGVPALKMAVKQLELASEHCDGPTVDARLSQVEREIARLKRSANAPT